MKKYYQIAGPIAAPIATVVAALVMASASAEITNMKAAQSTDMRADTLKAAPSMPLANTRKESVSFSWAIDADQTLNASSSYKASSQEYRTAVSKSQLRAGVTFTTTASGAVVTLSPSTAQKGAGLDTLGLVIKTPNGQLVRGSDSMDQLVDQTAIQATGIPFSNGMVGFRLRESLGSGKFVLSSESNVPASEYMMHVLDKNSSVSLDVQASPQVFVGNVLRASGEFNGGNIKRATAFLLNPQGQRVDAQIDTSGGAFTVAASADQAGNLNNGLWELHVSAMDQNDVQRDVKTAFAAVFPTARFDNVVNIRADQAFDFGIETASKGRYEVSGVLYGMVGKTMQPVAMAATAQWLEVGSSELSLQFDASVVKASGANAPFEVRYLALKDQSRMSILQTQEVAVHVSD